MQLLNDEQYTPVIIESINLAFSDMHILVHGIQISVEKGRAIGNELGVIDGVGIIGNGVVVVDGVGNIVGKLIISTFPKSKY